jgi:hypothetical protein
MLYRHSFRFYASYDLMGEQASGSAYHVLVKIDEVETSIRIPADQPHEPTPHSQMAGVGWFGFAIDAPHGAKVALLLVAVDRDGNQSTPLPVQWTVDGSRILARPGVLKGMLSMYKVEEIDGPVTAQNPNLVQLTVSAKKSQ